MPLALGLIQKSVLFFFFNLIINRYMHISMKKWTISLITAFVLFSSYGSYIATQLGSDMNGDAKNDSLSWNAISADGTILATSAFGADSNNISIYAWNGLNWIQRGDSISGETVSMNASGSIVAIGERNVSVGLAEAVGAISVYEWNGSSWIQRGNDIYGEAEYDRLYISTLNADGNVIAVGTGSNDGNGNQSGHVRIYAWNGFSWIQRGNDIDGEAEGDLSGRVISLNDNGDIIAIGASENDSQSTDGGHARIFEWNGLNWSQLGEDINGWEDGQGLGSSISLSADGHTIAIGSETASYNGKQWLGRVGIWEYRQNEPDDTLHWDNLGEDIHGKQSNDRFGESVELSSNGKILAVGTAFGRNDSDMRTGHVRMFEWNGNFWQQRIQINGVETFDCFGRFCSMNADGSIIAIGAEGNSEVAHDAGEIRVFQINPISYLIDNLTSQISTLQDSLSAIDVAAIVSNSASIASNKDDIINNHLGVMEDVINLSNSLAYEIEYNASDIDIIEDDILEGSNRLVTAEQDILDLQYEIEVTSNELNAAIQNVQNLQITLTSLLADEVVARHAADTSLSNTVNALVAETNNPLSVAEAKAMMMDLRPGSTTIDVVNGIATLSLSLEESGDLTSNWIERVENIEVDLPTTNNIEFFRFRMD